LPTRLKKGNASGMSDSVSMESESLQRLSTRL
jgi:hypothetical protein